MWLCRRGAAADDCEAVGALPGGAHVTFVARARLRGGMDFQNRAGSKPGSGGVASAQHEAIGRKERLRKLALETIDLAKDPYFMKNHLGTYECKLCLTLHTTEGNYLAHTQGKRHQDNLGKRAARERRDAPAPLPSAAAPAPEVRRTVKIGRPGYRVVRQHDAESGQRSLVFEVEYPRIEAGLQPRHRIMSAFEQRVERPDKRYQYLLFAAEPYETIAFKIPNRPLDKAVGKFSTSWDPATKRFTLSLAFALHDAAPPPPTAPPPRPVRYDV